MAKKKKDNKIETNPKNINHSNFIKYISSFIAAIDDIKYLEINLRVVLESNENIACQINQIKYKALPSHQYISIISKEEISNKEFFRYEKLLFNLLEEINTLANKLKIILFETKEKITILDSIINTLKRLNDVSYKSRVDQYFGLDLSILSYLIKISDYLEIQFQNRLISLDFGICKFEETIYQRDIGLDLLIDYIKDRIDTYLIFKGHSFY